MALAYFFYRSDSPTFAATGHFCRGHLLGCARFNGLRRGALRVCGYGFAAGWRLFATNFWSGV